MSMMEFMAHSTMLSTTMHLCSKKLVKLNDAEADDLIPTAVFGPTCDGLDQMCHFDKPVSQDARLVTGTGKSGCTSALALYSTVILTYQIRSCTL